jgi:hypothetical protein
VPRPHPTAHCVTHGMPDGALEALDARTKALLVKLMARVAERAYRRGAQQGAHLALTRPQDLPRDLAAWRFRPSTDLSPWLDRRVVKPSTERLFMENPGLELLGLPERDLSADAAP